MVRVSDGMLTDSDLVILTSHPTGTPLAPICTDISDKTTDMGVGVEVSAEGTTDPNGDALAYAWRVDSAPPDAGGTFENPTAQTTVLPRTFPGSISWL